MINFNTIVDTELENEMLKQLYKIILEIRYGKPFKKTCEICKMEIKHIG
jgi:hypothetical protein